MILRMAAAILPSAHFAHKQFCCINSSSRGMFMIRLPVGIGGGGLRLGGVAAAGVHGEHTALCARGEPSCSYKTPTPRQPLGAD